MLKALGQHGQHGQLGTQKCSSPPSVGMVLSLFRSLSNLHRGASLKVDGLEGNQGCWKTTEKLWPPWKGSNTGVQLPWWPQFLWLRAFLFSALATAAVRWLPGHWGRPLLGNTLKVCLPLVQSFFILMTNLCKTRLWASLILPTWSFCVKFTLYWSFFKYCNKLLWTLFHTGFFFSPDI